MSSRSKHEKYMDIARAVAQFSKDETKVGSVIIGPHFEIRSTGYNGAPRKCSADEDERMVGRPEKYYWIVHAELNAILAAARVGTPLEGCTILVTHFPCMDCSRSIVQVGIKHVIIAPMSTVFEERWQEHIKRSKMLFDECGVSYTMIDYEK